MKKQELEQWLTRATNSVKESWEIRRFSKEICICGIMNEIHVDDIFGIAEILGVKLKVKHRDCLEYPWTYYFDFNGVTVLGISEFRKEEYEDVETGE